MQTFRIIAALLIVTLVTTSSNAAEFAGNLPADANRVWIGPDYWTNPMEDWQLANGRLECFSRGEDRNVHLLTYELAEIKGEFAIGVRVGRI
ncbi:MAG: hypothetical protein MI741_01640, partial [Rhodospirillales bacterium]|nr:hypothetical protein [Rhodospirillales bacterium]